MNYELKALGALAGQYPAGGLFAAWLGHDELTVSSTATGELGRVWAAGPPERLAPLWQSPEFARLLPVAWRELPADPAVVVTGQQPGLWGGPLLTLYKIATAIALAGEMTAAGQPTVPVFWSGDDDDDLAEAMEPVAWARSRQELLRGPAQEMRRRSGAERTVLAAEGPAVWATPALTPLVAGGGGGLLPDSVVEVLRTATDAGLTWGAGQAALIGAIFTESNLVVVRGNDPELHAAAAPFYQTLAGRLPELSSLAQARGEALVAAGYHAQISKRSLSRPLFRLDGAQRRVCEDCHGIAASELRPGVMLRSPVQDWLMRPAAVVVGPGELAYLRQLDPLYAALGVPRSPLVPRLSGWILPEGRRGEDFAAVIGRQRNTATPDAELLADRVAAVAAQEITSTLVSALQLPPERAAELATGRARRFRKGLVAMFSAEAARHRQASLGNVPAWIMPDGLRQERSLSALSALGLWGAEFVPALLNAAGEHLAGGRQGDWQEWALLVPERTVAP